MSVDGPIESETGDVIVFVLKVPFPLRLKRTNNSVRLQQISFFSANHSNRDISCSDWLVFGRDFYGTNRYHGNGPKWEVQVEQNTKGL